MAPRSRSALALLLGLALAGCALAQPAPWPSRPIKFITGSAAGSGLDVLTRTVAQKLSEQLQTPVVVENRPGANQIIAAEACTKAAPDGYTFCSASIEPFVNNRYLFKKLSYDPDKLAPVAIWVNLTTAIMVRADLGAKTLPEVVALSKKMPGKLNWGSYGNGSISHLYLEAIRAEFGWDVTHITYKSTVDSAQALMANDVQIVYQQIGSLKPHVDSGALIPLAMGMPQRAPSLPNVPTFDEVGIGKYRFGGWWGLGAPAGVPAAIVEKMNQLTLAIVRQPELQPMMNSLSVEPAPAHTPADMAAMLRRDSGVARDVLQQARIQPN